MFFLLFVSFSFFFFLNSVSQATIRSSDLISSSAPGASSNHTIITGIMDDIPAQGRIDIVFDGDFFFPSDFDYTEVDLAVAATREGLYMDRPLSGSFSATDDFVSVSTGTLENIISINLSPTAGIPAGRYISIELGNNALLGAIGTSTQIVNSNATGLHSVEIRTYDSSGHYLERANIAIFVIEPVGMSNNVTKKRSGAAPVGWLGYGTSQTILSLYTNFKAICRYSTATNTPFSAMTEEFSYISSSTDSFYHTKLISGLSSGGSYTYYVRCIDESGVSDDETECIYDVASTTPFQTASGTPLLNVNCIDYPIPFRISSIAGSVGGEDNGSAGDEDNGGSNPGSGSSGGGSGGGAGGFSGKEKTKGKYLPYPPPPGAPGVALKGWSFPVIDVYITKDGTEEGYTTSDAKAAFASFLEITTQGIYTFGVWANDSDGRKSAPYTTTFWIDSGTQTEVVDIIIPPTIELSNSQAPVVESFSVLGKSVPSATVEVLLYPKKETEVRDDEIIRTETVVGSIGAWNTSVSIAGLDAGVYYIKAKVNVPNVGYSDFSNIIEAQIGTSTTEKVPSDGLCAGADLNGDGKVNITDFSILLYHWGGNDACADQNQNGKVDLTDFSIMMYNWTG